ncbi:hypothetical protein K4F52_002509 [Lecanicillium sp. MT-2017a]|nr:hypothetical protein K4F52_002509 [Lecanicillium sp. MT-2017a]
MATIESLPVEVVALIASHCRADRPLGSVGGAHAEWARTSRHFHSILNPLLYRWNLEKDVPLASCALWAAKEGRLETLVVACQHGANINANGASPNGKVLNPGGPTGPKLVQYVGTALQYALKYDHQHVVDYLLDNGADPHVDSHALCVCPTSRFSPYALHAALIHCNLKGAAELLVSKTGAYLIAEGRPALEADHAYREVKSSETSLVKLLVDLPGPGPSIAALHWAIAENDPALAAQVLARPGIDANVAGIDWKTPLHRALDAGDRRTVDLLLQRGEVNAGAQDHFGQTPLHYAVRDGHLDLVKVLLKRSDVNAMAADGSQTTPFQLAVTTQNVFIAREILNDSAVSADVADNTGMTPLHSAAADANVELVQMLLSRPEVSPARRDNRGLTVFHVACRQGNLPIIEMLRSRQDFSTTIRNNKGQTPLHYAAFRSGNAEALKLLLSHASDAQLASVDEKYRTLLHFIARNDDTSAVQPLVKTIIDRGVPVDHESSYGIAFHVAVENGNLETAMTLFSCGANVAAPHEYEFDFTTLHHILRWQTKPDIQTRLVSEILSSGVSIDNWTDSPSEYDDQSSLGSDGGEGDPKFGSDGTELFFAAAGAKNIDCMRLLLDAGANAKARVTIKQEFSYGCDLDDNESFLTAMFRHAWGKDIQVAKEMVEEMADRIVLLLEHGAEVGWSSRRDSALEEAASYASGSGMFGLLDLILANATAKNVRARHVQDVRRDESNEKVKGMLTEFLNREFTGEDIANSGFREDGDYDDQEDSD